MKFSLLNARRGSSAQAAIILPKIGIFAPSDFGTESSGVLSIPFKPCSRLYQPLCFVSRPKT